MDTPRSVLIVEDSAPTSRMLELLFRCEGYAPELVHDGRAALERLRGDPVALIVLDVMMPHANGVDVLRAVRRRPEWAGVPVIVTSARNADEEVWEGWRAGADYYLVKPYRIDVLWAVARDLLTTGEIPAV